MSGVQKVQRHHFCQKRMAILKASLYRTKAEIDFLHRTHTYGIWCVITHVYREK